MKKAKIKWKWLFPLFIFIVSLNLGSNLINKYWFPPEIRQYLLPPKFAAGQCIKAPKFWGVNPKSVVGHKIKGQEFYYLLKDQDRYEHLQLIHTSAVEKVATRVPCGRVN